MVSFAIQLSISFYLLNMNGVQYMDLSNSLQVRKEIMNTNTTYISKLLIESILLLCLKLILLLLEREVESVSS